MSIYIPVSETQTRCLIGKLFLSIPQIVNEIAPEGLENSAYSALQTRPIEADYKTYRSHRIFDYKYNRLAVKAGNKYVDMLKPEFLKSLEDFKMTFRPFFPEYPAGIIQAISHVIKDVFGSRCVVHSPELRSYSMGWEIPQYEFLSNLLNELNILPKNYLYNYGGQYLQPSSCDLAPFYAAVFKFLMQNGLNWQYRDEELSRLYFKMLGKQKDKLNIRNQVFESEEPSDEKTSLEEEVLQYRIKEIKEQQDRHYGYNRKTQRFYPSNYKRGEHHKDVWGNLVPVGYLGDSGHDPLTDVTRDFCLSRSNANLFRKEINRINKVTPHKSGKLAAYQKVYGSWPKGYPASEFDY